MIHVTASSVTSSLFVPPITCMQQPPPPHSAGNTLSPPHACLLLLPCKAPFIICIFSLRQPSSPSHRGGVMAAPNTRSSAAVRTNYVPSAICIIAACYLSARLTSPQGKQTPPHPRQREATATSCVYIHIPPPASTNQELEQGGRLGKHIVTDL